MRILGKLAVAAGATAVILLASPAANASAMDNVPRTSPLAAAQTVLGAVVGGLGHGLAGGAVSGLGGAALSGLGGGPLGGLGG